MKTRYIAMIAATLCAAQAATAKADDYNVYSPRAVKGEFALEANSNFDHDHRPDMNKYFSEVAGFEYALQTGGRRKSAPRWRNHPERTSRQPT